MNNIIVSGHTTKDPDYSTTPSGATVVKFTIAVKRKYKNENGEYDADFINCVAWKTLADNIHKFVKKGSHIMVRGALQVRTYDANDGTRKTVAEIVADECEFIKNADTPKTADAQKLTPIDDDDLPF